MNNTVFILMMSDSDYDCPRDEFLGAFTSIESAKNALNNYHAVVGKDIEMNVIEVCLDKYDPLGCGEEWTRIYQEKR